MNQILRFSVLGSGSDANAYCIADNRHALLIDNGFSCRELISRLDAADIDPKSLLAVLVTHDHHDHIRGVKTLSRKLGIPVCLSQVLAEKDPWDRMFPDPVICVPGKPLHFGPFCVTPFSTFHDSEGSLGYSAVWGEKRLTIITDTGRTDEVMAETARQSDVLFLEANYCPDMLENGSYPEFLKRRISSASGHLSNHDACTFLKHLDRKTRRVYLCHLSASNNTPGRVLETLETAGISSNAQYVVCSRGEMYCGEI